MSERSMVSQSSAAQAGFAHRQIGPTEDEQQTMLEALGLPSLDALIDQALPAAIRTAGKLDLPVAMTEIEATRHLRELANRNHPGRPMIGMGYYGTITPAVIRRNVLENPGWYTAYTPYQPEISQGRLEALLNFQTMVADLTGLPLAGSSLLDEGTALAEAVALAHRVSHRSGCVLVDAQILPQSLAVLRTRTRWLDIEVVVTDQLSRHPRLSEAVAVVVQTPGVDGRMQPTQELRELADAVHAAGGILIAAADLLALTLVVPPGQWGADIAVGSTQRFGVPLFYGGPHAGYIAVRTGMERQLPGRLVGVSVDADGAQAYRLALQTREQHIRREKATSNICTAQVLLAVAASMYAVYHGPDGLRRIAEGIHWSTRRLAGALAGAGMPPEYDTFFDTLTIRVAGRASDVVARARAAGVHLRLVDPDRVGISVGEDATQADLQAVAQVFGARLVDAPTDGDDASESVRASARAGQEWGGLGADVRAHDYLSHPVFNTYHSETQLMRYLRALENRDFGLDTGMIPLGSCTMKLNAAAEMEAISLPGFADLHPFVPLEDAEGYLQLIDDLERWLIAITGYDRISLQPNAGSQGEFTGLTAIRRYQQDHGEGQRDVCLIPSSAHGTNAASAAMAGLKVVVVKATEDGSVDLEDLAAKIRANEGRVSACMITYPSTHGVFEDTITELISMVHEAGGQVYVDGANMNALMGLAQPGGFGADVSHFNLHKTFAIPHGGGGPGVGPVGVRAHLAPYLPDHPLVKVGERLAPGGAVASAPFGSPGVLPISWAYIAMMGADGLRRTSQVAVLNANYIATRVSPAFPVLYTGRGGRVAHECILDLRPISAASHITVDDVAKRLIDYGFHAPTMSFPVPGTLMVEPTESEDLGELDRFCDAMLAIRAEIDRVASGEWPANDNPLVNAPHTALRVTADAWPHPYSRRTAVYPGGMRQGPIEGVGHDKYWPPVARIDNAYGDRNLMCTCPPLEDYED